MTEHILVIHSTFSETSKSEDECEFSLSQVQAEVQELFKNINWIRQTVSITPSNEEK